MDDSHKYNNHTLTIAERHAPVQLSEFLGNYTQSQEINGRLLASKEVKKGQKVGVVGGRAAHGGCGKTTLVALACKKYGKSAYIL